MARSCVVRASCANASARSANRLRNNHEVDYCLGGSLCRGGEEDADSLVFADGGGEGEYEGALPPQKGEGQRQGPTAPSSHRGGDAGGGGRPQFCLRHQQPHHHQTKKIFRRKRYTLAATWRDTTVPMPSGHSPSPFPFLPIPSPSSGRFLRRDGFRAPGTVITRGFALGLGEHPPVEAKLLVWWRRRFALS
eukprot:scaffold7720_cov129-Isochrysis_galbana.AAC.1